MLTGRCFVDRQRATRISDELAEVVQACIRVMGKLKTAKREAAKPAVPQVLKGKLSDLPIVRFDLGDAIEATAAPDIDTRNTEPT